jgi:DNA-directed RNA polymerase-3 subunit RPC5
MKDNKTEDEDEVIRELDVFVTDSTLDLFLLQFPLRPLYAEPPQIPTARFKPVHKKLEIEVPFASSNSSSSSDNSQIKQKFHSATVARGTCLAAAVIRDNEMHITSLQEVLQLRPSFKSMQSHAWEHIESMSDDETEQIVKETPVEQIQMKKRENDTTQSARTQSYAYLQAEEEKEQWHRLKVYPAGNLLIFLSLSLYLSLRLWKAFATM